MKETAFSFFLNGGIFIVAVFLSYLLALFFIRLSFLFNLLDYPADRKIHSRPIPFLGGADVFLSFWLLVLIGVIVASVFEKRPGLPDWMNQIFQGVVFLSPQILVIFLGSLIILLVGFFDDKFHWSPLKKMAGQVLAVFILMSLNLRINLVADWGIFGYCVTFIWVLLIINAFNFIDSLDGHSSGVAFISSMIFFWLVNIIHQPLVGLLLIAFAGSLLGFLMHNFKPAKIFLGDNGSLFVGYMMAALTLLCKYHAPHATYATTFIPVLIFGVPIYDTLSVITVRLIRGIPPWQGDRNHFAHRLVKIGMSEKVAVLFSYFVTFTIGNVAILSTQVNFFGAIIISIIFVSILAMIAFMEFYVAGGIRFER